MGSINRLAITFGLVFLAHAGYSTHEHSILYGSEHPIPLDITLETLIAVVLVIFGLVLGAEKQRPISWSAWAGEIENKQGGIDNPFRVLEDCPGFMDIRAKRKEFADWVRRQDSSPVKR